jgi:tRNA pseudouridine38-40 synthase
LISISGKCFVDAQGRAEEVLDKNTICMRTIKLIVEYDGTDYVGWQVQPNGVSVQQVIEAAIEKLLGEATRLQSSGRTDSGVHARGMVASFRTWKSLPLRAFSDGLNSLLPPDIAIRDAADVAAGFNPRRDATGKHYRYTILNAPRRSPLDRHFVWHLRGNLNLADMQRAAAYFVGEKNFAAFRAANCNAATTVRRIDSVGVTRSGDYIVMDVKGSGFLKNMVRIMAGTLVGVGQGVLAAESIPGLLSAGDRKKAGITAPPQGLCLVEVYY